VTGSLTITIPTLGDPNAAADPQVRTGLIALRDYLNGVLTSDNYLDGSQVKAQSATAGQIPIFNSSSLQVATSLSGDVTVNSSGVTAIGNTKVTNAMLAGSIAAAKLAADTQATYKTIFQATAITTGATTTSTFLMNNTPTNAGEPPVSGADIASLTTAGSPPFFRFTAADYAFGSLTTKLRLRAQLASNATGSGITYTVGLYPVAVAGAAGALTLTLGTVVPGSQVSFVNPTASTVNQNNSGDFTIPSDGSHMLGFTTSGSAAANNVSLLSAQLQVRNV
jgi:hypothetical protein